MKFLAAVSAILLLVVSLAYGQKQTTSNHGQEPAIADDGDANLPVDSGAKVLSDRDPSASTPYSDEETQKTDSVKGAEKASSKNMPIDQD